MTPSKLQPKSRPHYDNALLISRDGKPLTTAAYDKLDWYLARGLGVEVNDYPDKRFTRVVQLTFQHGGNAVRPTDLELVENKCVVCGSTTDLSLHHCVPYRIKRFYPMEDRQWTRHQCVLVCADHHAAAEVEAAKVPDAHRSFSRFMQQATRLLHRALAWLRYPYFALWSLRYGGVKGVNAMYREAFLRLNPKHLPKGWLE